MESVAFIGSDPPRQTSYSKRRQCCHLLAEPAFRATVKRELRDSPAVEPQTWALVMALETLEVSASAERPELDGRRVPEIAAQRGVDPLDLTLDLSVPSGLEAGFRIPLANTNESAIATLLTVPLTVLGLSDAGAHASQLRDACFSTHLLGRWVRNKGALTLKQAIDHLCAPVSGLRSRRTGTVGPRLRRRRRGV